MRMYQTPPSFDRPIDSDVPLFKITTASNVCSTDAYTMAFPDPNNRYLNLMSLTFTDDECDALMEALAEARAKRILEQERTYETLHAKFGGTWNNYPAEVKCVNCGGSGQTGSADDPESCTRCHGTGIVTE